MKKVFLTILSLAVAFHSLTGSARAPQVNSLLSEWARQAQSRRLTEYFPDWQKNLFLEPQKQKLKMDLANLIHEYKRQAPSSQDERFVQAWLWPAVDHMSLAQMQYVPPGQPHAVSRMNLDQYIAAQLWDYWSSQPEARENPKFLLEKMDGTMAEMEGMSRKGWDTFLSISKYFLAFLGSTAWMLIVTSPLTNAANAATSPVTTPFTEKIKVFCQNRFGGASKWLTGVLNKKEMVEDGANKNDAKLKGQVILGDRFNIHNDFGGQTPQDQAENMPHLQQAWAESYWDYSRLFTDIYHHGRGMVDHIMQGEREAITAVELMNARIQIAVTQNLLIAMPLKIDARARNIEGRVAHIEDLLARYSDAFKLTTLKQLTPQGVERRNAIIEPIVADMAKVGFSEGEIATFKSNHIQIQQVTVAKATALATQLVVDFGRPEGNRNAGPTSQRIQVQIRVKFGLERETDQLLPLVQEILRLMGFRVTGSSMPPPPPANDIYRCVEDRLSDEGGEVCKPGIMDEQEQREVARHPDPKIEAKIEGLKSQMLNDPQNYLFDKLYDVANDNLRERIARRLAVMGVTKRTSQMDLRSTFIEVVRDCVRNRFAEEPPPSAPPPPPAAAAAAK